MYLSGREKTGKRVKRLRREITLESNFRVNLIWVGWVNFNLGGFFFFNLDWINFFLVGLFLNGYAMSYPSCH